MCKDALGAELPGTFKVSIERGTLQIKVLVPVEMCHQTHLINMENILCPPLLLALYV